MLTEVHRLSVVHRDIKPRNLFITPGGVVKVLDFGVAALFGAGELTKLTMVGQTVGTPPYMAPEQALANAVGPPADLYALGCVLHELLTGQLPFTATGGMSVQWHHVHTSPAPLRTIRPDIPESVEALVLKLLAKSPEERAQPGRGLRHPPAPRVGRHRERPAWRARPDAPLHPADGSLSPRVAHRYLFQQPPQARRRCLQPRLTP